jgi:dihydroxyacetone kinase-like protein
MKQQVTIKNIAEMMNAASILITQSHLRLSELDSIGGDGDHGATMLRVVERLKESFGFDLPIDFKERFHQAGWNVLGADGGASSSLIGAFFMGMADSLGTGVLSLNCIDLARSFESGLQAVKCNTAAKPGDKTMLDALAPAVEAFVITAEACSDIAYSLRRAAEAANEGAEATKDFSARFGRARLLGDKTKGYPDPGAVSISLLFKGFYEGYTGSKGD